MNKTLATYLQDASFGVLSDLKAGGNGSGLIPESHRGRVINAFNQALILLYTRFALRRDTVEIQTHEGWYDYKLHLDFAQMSGSSQPVKYIMDTPALPFLGRVRKIEYLYDAEGHNVPIGDRKDEASWFTPMFDTLRTLAPVDGARFHVDYRLGHPQLLNTPVLTPNPEPGKDDIPSYTENDQQILELPDFLEPAFFAKVGALVYGSMGMEGAVVKSADLHAQYELHCLEVESRDLVGESEVETNQKPRNGGWI